MSFLSKYLKFFPTSNKIDQKKAELEEYGRKFRLMRQFKNDEWFFVNDKCRPKSSINPRNNDVIKETYLSCLGQLIIKGAGKKSLVVVWYREDYLKKTYKQLDDKEVYEHVPNDSSVLVNTIMKALAKIRLIDDLWKDTLNYFLVQFAKFARFYLLPKTHK